MDLETAKTVAIFIGAATGFIGAVTGLSNLFLNLISKQAKIDYCDLHSGNVHKYVNLEQKPYVEFNIVFKDSGGEAFRIEEGLFAHFDPSSIQQCPKPTRVPEEKKVGKPGRMISYQIHLPADREAMYVIAAKLTYKSQRFLSRRKSELFLVKCILRYEQTEEHNQNQSRVIPLLTEITLGYEYDQIKEKLPKDFD
jgi:hypothetical protein